MRELRNPWGTAGIPSRRNNAVNVMSDISLPPGIAGKTSPSGPVNPQTSVNIPMALSDRGILYARRAFILMAGISQVFLSHWISPQGLLIVGQQSDEG